MKFEFTFYWHLIRTDWLGQWHGFTMQLSNFFETSILLQVSGRWCLCKDLISPCSVRSITNATEIPLCRKIDQSVKIIVLVWSCMLLLIGSSWHTTHNLNAELKSPRYGKRYGIIHFGTPTWTPIWEDVLKYCRQMLPKNHPLHTIFNHHTLMHAKHESHHVVTQQKNTTR